MEFNDDFFEEQDELQRMDEDQMSPEEYLLEHALDETLEVEEGHYDPMLGYVSG